MRTSGRRTSSPSSGLPASGSRALPGSSTSIWTASRRRVLASRSLPRLWRGRVVLGPRRDGAHARRDRGRRGAGVGAAQAPSHARGYVADGDERDVDRAAARAPACAGRVTSRERATFSQAGGCSSSGSPNRARSSLVFEDMQWADARSAGVCRLPARLVAQPSALRRRAGAPGAGRAAPDWASGHAELDEPRSSRSRTTRWRRCSTASSRAPRRAPAADARPRRGRPALRGRDGPDAARPRLARAAMAAATGRRGRSTRSRCPRRSTRWSPPASMASLPDERQLAPGRLRAGQDVRAGHAGRGREHPARPRSTAC